MRSEASVDRLDAGPDLGERYKWLATGRNGNYKLIWIVAVMDLDNLHVHHFGYIREGASVVTPFTPGGYMPRYEVQQRSADISPELPLGYVNALRPHMYDVPDTIEAVTRLFIQMQVADPKTWFDSLHKVLEPYGDEAARLHQDIRSHTPDEAQMERLTNDTVLFLWERRPW
jgi:hypothetical protein